MEDNACVLLRNPRSLRVMLLFLTEWGEIIEHLSFWQYLFRWHGRHSFVENELFRTFCDVWKSILISVTLSAFDGGRIIVVFVTANNWFGPYGFQFFYVKNFLLLLSWDKWLTLILKQNSAWLHSISIKIFRTLCECGGWNVRNSYVSFVNSQHSKFKFLVPRGSDKLWELSLVTGGRRKSLFWINSDIE